MLVEPALSAPMYRRFGKRAVVDVVVSPPMGACGRPLGRAAGGHSD